MSDALRKFVFPQDQPNGDAGQARAGGLTLREYAAVHIAASLAMLDDRKPAAVASTAITLADCLVTQLG